ncbi:MAG: RagB/SusD family nutrient uptake outer membrane protein [Chitinophagaceae bacterium]
MKNNIIYLIAFTAVITVSCKKSFIQDVQPYGSLDESAFANQTETGWYIDRMYNFDFAGFKSPTSNIASAGSWDDSKTKNTEEIGGTVSSYINPNKTLQLAADGDAYYGTTLASSGYPNAPYNRIRLANLLLSKIDGIGKALPAAFRATSKGQMYYFRALEYFYLVRAYGGVPLVLTVQDASNTDTTIRTPRSTATQCFTQILKDFDSAAALLPAKWANGGTDYGRFTSAAALAMKSRVTLYAASPLFNNDWDNTGNAKWQAALKAGLDAETYLTSNGYGLYGSTAKEWQQMTYVADNAFNKEAIFVNLMSTTITSSTGYNNSWENGVRPKDMNGSGGVSVPKGMLDLFPLANGMRPTAANGYVDTFFFENRDPRFYRTFAFSGSKWGTKTNANRTTFFYRWKTSATATTAAYSGYNGGNQTTSPAEVFKFSNPAADTSALTYSGTDIFEYRYAELLLNIAECYAATGDISNCITYLGKIRARVGIPATNNYGIGTLADKYAALEACLYERRVELAYEGKRYWDVQRWLLYDGTAATYTGSNTCDKLRLPHINGTNRTGYYWQSLTYSAATVDPLTATDKNILIDPDNTGTFTAQIAALKTLYKNKFIMTPLDKPLDVDGTTAINILYRPNYYLSGLTSTVLSYNPWLAQTLGWMDANGGTGAFNSAQ